MSGAAPKFLIGDPIPRLAVPDLEGKLVDFWHQERAGKTLLLVLARGIEEVRAPMVEALASLPPGEAAIAVVLSDAPVASEVPAEVLALLDPASELASALGTQPPAIVVVGADTRLEGVLAGHDFRAARALVDRLHAATSADRIVAQAPVALVEGVFEPELCHRLISFWETGRQVSDMTSSTRSHSNAAASVKKRTDVVVEDQDLVAILRERLARRVISEIRKAFQVEIVRHEALRIGCYDGQQGGYFRRHRDNATPYTRHRRFALTANLNDGYVGGELRFPEYGRMLYRPPPGGAVIFSCSLLHEALPVTEGRRFALFTFFTDRSGAEEERMLAERERVAGRSG